jgi:hypothetical protein
MVGYETIAIIAAGRLSNAFEWHWYSYCVFPSRCVLTDYKVSEFVHAIELRKCYVHASGLLVPHTSRQSTYKYLSFERTYSRVMILTKLNVQEHQTCQTHRVMPGGYCDVATFEHHDYSQQ